MPELLIISSLKHFKVCIFIRKQYQQEDQLFNNNNATLILFRKRESRDLIKVSKAAAITG